ncbi:MAG TPA: hypothetical protein VG057_13635, partial [Solirubrobacteraceae bacterium]|nr:hypothetical protein [Solirubrobacteraceae bacterium]
TLTFDAERMRVAADDPEAAATDLAEHLVAKGVPFRDAHAAVGALVRRSHDEGIPLVDLVAQDSRLRDATSLLAPGAAVRRRTTPGGSGPEPVRAQLEAARLELDRQRAWLDG